MTLVLLTTSEEGYSVSGWERLQLADGPACTRCGCNDCMVLQRPQSGVTWYPTGRARCRHCNNVFAFNASVEEPQAVSVVAEPTQLPPVDIQQSGPLSTRVDVMYPAIGITADPSSCPSCGGKGLVKSTQGRMQYRQCKACGERFKTQKEVG